MEPGSTRQRALDAALELFSQRGYNGVSMADIAEVLAIKPPSLYKHFKGKEDLYSALCPIAEGHYRELWSAVGQAQEPLEHRAAAAGHLSAEALEAETMAWFAPELSDARAQHCRRLVNGSLGGGWLWETPIALYEGFFTRLIGRQLLRRGDPHVMAVEYLSPLLQLLAQQDAHPEHPGDVYREEAQRHIRQFHRIFAHKEAKPGPQGPVGRLFRR